MEDKEAIYDEQIAPLMTQLLEVCQRKGIPMFASFQYSDDGFCTSAQSAGHCVFDHYRALAQCAEPGGVNVDKYMNWVAKDARKNGHSSIYLKMAGVPLTPDETPSAPTYSYSTDDELYRGEFDSPDAAAAEAFYDDPELEAVSIGENRKHTAHHYVSADRILEDVTERAYDECGEASEDWLDGVMHNADKKAELEKLVGDWLQAQEPPNFWRVANTRQITRAEMVAAGKLDSDAA